MLHPLHPNPYRDVGQLISRLLLISVPVGALVAGYVLWQGLPDEPVHVAETSTSALILAVAEKRPADATEAVSAASLPDAIEELDPVGAGLFP